MNDKEIIGLFREHGLRATPQRIAVYKYLYENRTHTDADEIYRKVVEMYPSFSKTTVYNSLNSLENQGLILKINIDSQRVRYDANTRLHGHFICDNCKKIYDFNVENIVFSLPNGFAVHEKNVYCRGICPQCK